MKPEERIETKLMIVIGKLLETAQYIDSIHTFWYFTEVQSSLKRLYLSQ